jgi:CMP-N,N'-diacetyllegionaminic acid synthase
MEKLPSSPILAVIPARGGSRGVPGKNIRMLCGKPLIAWTIEAAINSQSVGRIIVSTNDPQIASVSREYGAEVLERPAEISGDQSASEDALIHAINSLDTRPEAMVFLQATAPFRRNDDIDRAVRIFRETQLDTVFSVAPSHDILWTEQDGRPVPVNHNPGKRLMRQNAAPQFKENGSIYVIRTSSLMENNSRFGKRLAVYKMAPEAALDIDSEFDFEIAETLMERLHYDN